MKSLIAGGLILMLLGGVSAMAADNPNPPDHPVKLIFIHHSTGENWLNDENGQLGLALRDNNYFVSDTNYGWGPLSIGDNTDIGNWWQWFRGPDSATILAALYAESSQNCYYTRLDSDPGGENEIVMFKSCFPNSALQGGPYDFIPPIDDNPLRGESSGSDYHTVANAKGIYNDLLEYFRTRPDKLFIAITAPPLSDPAWAANARAFNQWLVNEWLQGYTYPNVFVFDFYNVLTTSGGSSGINDLGWESGNHHRWWQGAVQHKADVQNDTSAYPSDDDHPSQAGNLKATGEFPSLLNVAYHRWHDQQPESADGDVNGDGEVDALDLAVMVDVLAGHVAEWQSPCTQPVRGDFNHSGHIDTADLAALAGWLAGN